MGVRKLTVPTPPAQVHIFIFLLAISLIVTGSIAMLINKTRVKKWRVWEAGSEAFDTAFDKPPAQRMAQDMESSRRAHGCCGSACENSTGSKATFLHLRRYFIRKHRRNQRFDFLTYIGHCMEDDYSTMVTIDSVDWMIAILSVVLRDWYFNLWCSCFTMFASILIHRKLDEIIQMMVKDTLAMSKNHSHSASRLQISQLEGAMSAGGSFGKVCGPIIQFGTPAPVPAI